MWRLVLPVAIAILPLTLAAQNAARTPDESLKAESYQTPPRELADAVLAPRYLNVTLTNASPDEKWVAAANTAPTNTTTTPDDTAPQAPAATAGGRNSQGGVERFVVARADGFKFRVKVVLPPDYQEGTRLPALFWFYPREFATQEDYDRPDRTFNKNSFTNFGARSMEYFTRLGYAVVDPDTPIVGPQGQMNNNYVNDLRNDLAATIDELDRRQIIDRQCLAIGGHSYGAFSTVNAMVNTPFFKAGLAGDGAYNRTTDQALVVR